MPLTDEQKAAIATLATVSDGDLEEATTALKDKAQPVFQKVFRKGYGTAQGEYEGESGKLTKATTEAEAQKTRANKAEADLAEARKKQPDLDTALKKNNDEWQAKLDAATGETKAEREARQKERRARMKADLRAELGVINDSEFAEFLAEKHMARLEAKDDGSIVLKEAPDSTVPVQVPQGQTPYKVLAGDILKTVAPDKKRSDTDSGGGTGGGGGGGGKPTADEIKKATENTVPYVI